MGCASSVLTGMMVRMTVRASCTGRMGTVALQCAVSVTSAMTLGPLPHACILDCPAGRAEVWRPTSGLHLEDTSTKLN
jgi:hypothetical protein